MTDFIRTLNEADRLARLFLLGDLAAIVLLARLTERGFYEINLSPPSAKLLGVRYNLGE